MSEIISSGRRHGQTNRSAYQIVTVATKANVKQTVVVLNDTAKISLSDAIDYWCKMLRCDRALIEIQTMKELSK